MAESDKVTVIVENKSTSTKQSHPEPNIMFVGGEDRIPEKRFNGLENPIVMPDEKVQRKPFYHEQAKKIVQISPYYKLVKPKGQTLNQKY